MCPLCIANIAVLATTSSGGVAAFALKTFRSRRQPKEKNAMKTTELELDRKVVSAKEWEAARQQLLVKEKELTRARDALAAERRRMPWVAVEKDYAFDGPKGRASLLGLFDGRRQLIVYRAFLEPGVHGWPEHEMRPGDPVLIWGGSGGLGSMAIQIVKQLGGVPVAVVSSEDKFEFCLKLGAKGCINRKDFDHRPAAVRTPALGSTPGDLSFH